MNYNRFEWLYVIWVLLGVQCLKVIMAIGIIAFDLVVLATPTSTRIFKLTARNFTTKISTYEKLIEPVGFVVHIII